MKCSRLGCDWISGKLSFLEDPPPGLLWLASLLDAFVRNCDVLSYCWFHGGLLHINMVMILQHRKILVTHALKRNEKLYV
jgi:hypothetical protein